jgi:hypothetical protein
MVCIIEEKSNNIVARAANLHQNERRPDLIYVSFVGFSVFVQ